ncbi:MAG: T9SS type A sorting domain-containing protein [Flavobacteriales bacterium]|nr:T9SS type A sorting domain-containing protein [Flavobacteriales bacterium]
MKKTFTLIAAILGFVSLSTAQIGATAPDFTVTDLDGNTHNLYEYLDAGKVVIVDVSATWCNPCWEFHMASFLEDIQSIYGPEGTDQVRVLFYEGDAATTLADLQGTTGATQGDWLTGSNYPIINESPITLDLNIWAPFGFPTINVIRPSDKVIIEDLWNQWAAHPDSDLDAFAAMEEVINGVVGLNEITQAAWSVYPNPTNGVININSSQIHGNSVQLDVVNTMGQIVFSQLVQSTEISGTYALDLTHLDNGQYVLRMTDEKSVLTKTVNIQ